MRRRLSLGQGGKELLVDVGEEDLDEEAEVDPLEEELVGGVGLAAVGVEGEEVEDAAGKHVD